MYIYVRVNISIYIFFSNLFWETQRNKKNVVQPTKFGVKPAREVPYVHVSHCNCPGKMHDIYTQI